MCCVRGKTLFLCKSLRGNQGVPGQDKKELNQKRENEKKSLKINLSPGSNSPRVNNANFHPGGPSNSATINTYFWSMHNN